MGANDVGHIPIIPYAPSRRASYSSVDPAEQASSAPEPAMNSPLRQNYYDSLMILFPVSVVISICFVIHGIAKGWV